MAFLYAWHLHILLSPRDRTRYATKLKFRQSKTKQHCTRIRSIQIKTAWSNLAVKSRINHKQRRKSSSSRGTAQTKVMARRDGSGGKDVAVFVAGAAAGAATLYLLLTRRTRCNERTSPSPSTTRVPVVCVSLVDVELFRSEMRSWREHSLVHVLYLFLGIQHGTSKYANMNVVAVWSVVLSSQLQP